MYSFCLDLAGFIIKHRLKLDLAASRQTLQVRHCAQAPWPGQTAEESHALYVGTPSVFLYGTVSVFPISLASRYENDEAITLSATAAITSTQSVLMTMMANSPCPWRACNPYCPFSILRPKFRCRLRLQGAMAGSALTMLVLLAADPVIIQ
ncbi:hypothetical protein V8C44DRAFT_35989 [Trichoderma aethiopicum]